MQSDKDLSKLELDESEDSAEENQEKSLQWLLEMDHSDPEETLFQVSKNEYRDEGLTAYEAEVAARPLVRGNTGGDDLENYVAEEIVISSDGAASDIFSESSVAGGADEDKQEEVMAIDFTAVRDDASGEVSSVDEGTDILGLASEDDIGEKDLVIKRVKSEKRRPAHPAKASETAEDSPDLVNLTNAPVTTKIAEPGEAVVANAEHSTLVADEQVAETFESIESVGVSANQQDIEGFDSLGSLDLADEAILGESATEASVPEDAALEELTFETVVPEENTALEELTFETVVPEENAALEELTFETVVPEENAALEELTFETVATEETGFEDKVAEDSVEGFESLDQEEGFESLASAAEALGEDAFDDLTFGEIKTEELNEAPGPVFGALEAGSESLVDDLSVEALQDAFVEAGSDINDSDFEAVLEDFSVEDDFPVEHDLSTVDNVSEESLSEEAFEHGEIEFGLEDTVEDILSGSLEEDIAAIGVADEPATDIEDAFSNLSGDERDDDDICGIDFSEFDDGAAPEQEMPAEPEELQPAAGLQDAGDSVLDGERLDEVGGLDEVPANEEEDVLAWCIPSHIKFSYTSQSGNEIFAEFLDAFIEEGSAEVEKLENIVSEWEKDVDNETFPADMSRTLHTVKGIAKGVGLQRFGTLIHNYETLLEGLEGPSADEETFFRIVNAWLDAVVRGLEFVVDHRVDIASELPVLGSGAQEKLPETELSAVEKAVAAVQDTEVEDSIEEQAPEAADPGTETILSDLEKKRDQQLADEGAKALAAQQSVRITSEKLDHMLNLSNQAQQLGVRAAQNTTRGKRSTAELMGRLSSVRSHIGKIADRALLNVNARGGSHTNDLDALEMDQYSELQEAASILREGVEDLADLVDLVSRQNIQIEALLKQQSSVISSISTSIRGARVVPVSRMMPALRRIVRTVSTDLGKVVNFKVLNEIGALDRDYYAKLQVIMEHMVRNALDHGIESPDERLAAGKPTGGRITVDVHKSGEDYVVRLSDDGRGIDADALRESAFEKGLDVNVDSMSDEEVMRLIFHKGFSTANKLSEISGRGVGMDIVLTELQQMGGDIHIQSLVGMGTTFEIRIPSNVSVNGALMVAAGDESYAIPFNGLIAVEQVPVNDFYTAIENSESLELFDFDCEPAYLATLCTGAVLPDRTVWEETVPVIIAGTGQRHMAIAIDSVQEALELVVRSLGSQFSGVPGLAGAATTTDGEAIVALDLNLLVSTAGAEGYSSLEVGDDGNASLLALVVDDSRTQRMVATSQLDTVGVETVTAENGLVAIDLLNAAHRLPDVVLLDVEMPVKDGIETLREIRKSQRYGHLPVIMVTSRTGAKHRALAKDAGCNAYMGKPFNFSALVEQINSLTGHDLQIS